MSTIFLDSWWLRLQIPILGWGCIAEQANNFWTDSTVYDMNNSGRVRQRGWAQKWVQKKRKVELIFTVSVGKKNWVGLNFFFHGMSLQPNTLSYRNFMASDCRIHILWFPFGIILFWIHEVLLFDSGTF